MATEEQKIDFLKCALSESQNVIRAYDTKSQALGALLTLVVGLINFTFVNSTKTDSILQWLLVASTIAGVASAVLAGVVLYPHGNPAKKVDKHAVVTSGTYFALMPPGAVNYNLASYLSNIGTTDVITELGYELLKTAVIRDRKSFWFKFAMRASLVALILVIATVIRASVWR